MIVRNQRILELEKKAENRYEEDGQSFGEQNFNEKSIEIIDVDEEEPKVVAPKFNIFERGQY